MLTDSFHGYLARSSGLGKTGRSSRNSWWAAWLRGNSEKLSDMPSRATARGAASDHATWRWPTGPAYYTRHAEAPR